MKKKDKCGRTSVYDKAIAPNLDTIRSMAQAGVTQVKMREILGISRPTWDKYKKEKKDFFDAVNAKRVPPKDGHAEDVKELEAALMMIAKGFTRRQTRFINTRDGIEAVEEEVYFPPNFQALRFLLMNWAGYMSEPAAQAQREKEFEHKKAMDDKNNW